MDLVYCLFPFMTIKAFTVFEGIQLMMAFSFCVRFFFLPHVLNSGGLLSILERHK